MVMLSHYTSLGGLQGIAQSQSLRATDFLSLNDGDEFMYGMKEIMHAAMSIVISKIPSDIRNNEPIENLYSQVSQYAEHMRELIRQGNGYDTVYVVSFARGRNDFEEQQGILTLWRCYTNTQGYCLQYSRDQIRSLLSPESIFYSYALLDLVDVKYGIDESDPEFQYLSQQFALWLLTELAQSRNDPRFLEGMPLKHAQSQITGRLLKFCCTHKNPAYVDEREMRIFAIPVNQAITQAFRPTLPKEVRVTPTGSKYIVFGENRTPTLRPNRIIIGPNAKLNEVEVAALFPNTIHAFTPIISKSNIAIRPDVSVTVS